jgi:class 3 adenylate cyclase
LLFTDIEGSTVLLSRLGPAYADALERQRMVFRQAWAAHGGMEMGTEGDSFFVAGDHDSAVPARCLKQLSDNLSAAGNLDRAYECATSSDDIWRRLGDTTSLATAVGALGALELERGHADTAPTLTREAMQCARNSGVWARVIWELEQLASVETYLHNHQHALELQIEARDTAQRYGAYSEVLDIRRTWRPRCERWAA